MTAVYRNFSQAELDAEYNNRALVPDHEAVMAVWARQSETAAARADATLNVSYSDNKSHKLDIFPVNEKNPARTLVFIHGGYWQALDHSVFRFPAGAVNDAGMTYVSLGYPLAPGVTVDEIVDSVRSGLGWIWRNGKDHGIDPGEIHIAGHSAGGHLVAMMMGTVWPAVASDLPADLVKSGTAISGLYDLEPIRLSYLNEALGLDAEAASRNSPVNHPPPPERGPLLAVVGGDESAEFHRQQEDYLALLEGHGANAIGFVLPGANHFTIVNQLADPDSTVLGAITAMVFGDK